LKLFDLKTLGELSTGRLKSRQNRFLALADVDGREAKVHIPDTGRLEEILTPGRELLLLKNRPGLKTHCTLIAAKMEEGWVLINTRLHIPIAKAALQKGLLGFRPQRIETEVTFGESRIDFLADDTYIELKGCSLVQDGVCLFPNAPTTRGVKHIRDLIAAKEAGYNAAVLILGLRRCQCFAPHPSRDENFKKIFDEAMARGVQFMGFFIKIDQNLEICYDGSLKLCYNNA
jgi:sugar fermentation stimulation protein A